MGRRGIHQTKNIDEISFEHRLYDIKELEELLSKEGLKINRVYGSFQRDKLKKNNNPKRKALKNWI